MNWSDAIIALWGLLGGLMRMLNQAVLHGKQPSIMFIISNALLAGFCGFLAAKAIGKIDADWTAVAAGAAGFLGTQTIDILVAIVNKGKMDDRK